MSKLPRFLGNLKIIDPKNLSIEHQREIKNGKTLPVTRYYPDKNDRMIRSDGKIIWNGKYFLFVPENEVPLAR